MATIVWTGGAGDRNWNNPANWSIAGNPAGRTPAAADVVEIGAGVTGPSSILLNNATAVSIPSTTMNNQGQITVDSSGSLTDLVWAGSTTLQGGGDIVLSDAANNRIFSFTAGSVLTNVDNTISGAGQIFQNSGLSIVNQAAGIIDATGTSNALQLQNIGVTNNGLMQGSGAAGLRLGSGTTISGTGTLRANDGSHVDLNGATTISGQTLVSAGSGRVQTTAGGAVLDSTASQVHIAAGSTLHVNNATNLTLRGTLDNAGTLSLESSGSVTDLIIQGDVALDGGGRLTMSDQINNRVYTFTAGSTLTNVNNTIEGGGHIFRNSGLMFINGASGVVDANAANTALQFLNINVDNAGLMQASGAGGLLLGNGAIVGGTGTIRANDGSHVDLVGGTVISGQTLVSAGSGRVQTTAGGAVLDNTASQVHIAAGSTLHVNNATNLTLRGTLDNAGTLSLESSGSLTDLIIEGDVALDGGGRLTMSDQTNNRVYTFTAGSTLTNVNNTIEGAGHFFRNSGLTFFNGASGVVDGNAANTALQFLNINVVNAGLMQASGAGGLLLGTGAIISGIGETVGTIRANAGSHVDLVGGTVISGQTLESIGSGRLQTIAGGATLDGTLSEVNIAAGSTLHVNNATNLTLQGSIDNAGVLSLESSGSLTDLLIVGDVTLTGGGRVELSDNFNNRIYTFTAGSTLTNANNTISGAGQIFNVSGLSLVNMTDGTIEANGGNALSLSTGSFTNDGILHAATGSTMNVQAAGFTNLSGGTLTGGFYFVDDNARINFTGASAAPITTLAADVSLGAGSFLGETNGTPTGLDQSLTNIAVGAHLSLFGHNSNWANAVVVNGTLNLNADTYTSAQGLTIALGGGTGGNGTYATNVTNNGIAVAAGGVLTFAQSVTGTGTVLITDASTAEFRAAAASSGLVNFDGNVNALTDTLEIDNAAVFDAQIGNFGSDDRIHLTGVAGAQVVLAGSDLLVQTAGGTTLAALTLVGDYTGRTFSIASDGAAGSYVTVAPAVTNHAPVAVGDSYAIGHNNVLSVTAPLAGLLGNDSDQDGNGLTVVLVGGPSHGTLLLNADGTFTYDPDNAFAGADSFTYRAFDGLAFSEIATVLLDVTNAAPVTNANTYATDNGAPLVVGGAGVLGNDTDADGDALTAQLVAATTHGTLALQPDGSFTYTADEGFAGADTFTYRAVDALGALGAVQTVTINVTQANRAPVANGGDGTGNLPYYAATPGTTVHWNAFTSGLLRNDTDPDGDRLTARLVEGPYFYRGDEIVPDNRASVIVHPDGSISIRVEAYNFGIDYIKYVAVDEHGLESAPIEVAINIGALAPNDPPPPPPNDPDDPNNPDGPQDPNFPGDPNGSDGNPPNPGNGGNGDGANTNPANDPRRYPGGPDRPPGPDSPGTDTDWEGWEDWDMWGDVHASTFEGLHYEFQAVGEFVAARSIAGDTFELQLRMGAWGSSVSVNTAVGTLIDGHEVSYDTLTDELRIDDVVVTLASNSSIAVGGGAVHQGGNGRFAFTYADGQQVVYFSDAGNYLNVNMVATSARAAEMVGLGHSVGGVLFKADGTPMPINPTSDEFYINADSYANSWRITDPTSLFHYEAGETTADYSDPLFPRWAVGIDDLPADLVAAAAAKVAAAGITDPALRDKAILDLVLTGDPRILAGSQSAGAPTGTVDVQSTPPPKLIGIGANTLALPEGDSGVTTFTFTVYRTSPVGAVSVDWTVSDTGFNIGSPAAAGDFAGGAMPFGTVSFADGETAKTITVQIQGDTTIERNEQFAVTLGNLSSPDYALIQNGIQALIQDDDARAPSIVNELYVADQGQTITGNVLDNDAGNNGLPLTARLSQGPAHGTLVLNPDGSFTYTPNASFAGTDAFYYRASDDFSSSPAQVVQITINPTGDIAPELVAVLTTGPLAEATDASAQLLATAGSIQVRDVDLGDTLTVSTVGAPIVQLNGANVPATLAARIAALSAPGALTFGTPATADGTVQTVTWSYLPAAADLDFLKAGDVLTIRYGVKVGDGTIDSAAQNLVITVLGTNDGPVNVVPGAQSATAGVAKAIAGLSVSDRDDATITARVSAGGTMTVAAAGTATVDGNATGGLTIRGSLADVNLTLATLSYLRGVAGPDTIVLETEDATGAIDSDTVAVTVAAAGNPGVTITGTDGNDRIDTARTVAGQSKATARDDTILGLGGNDTLGGGAGNDTLVGGTGNDVIDGGAGSDRMEGGGGANTYTVDNAGDIVIEDTDADPTQPSTVPGRPDVQLKDQVRASVDYGLGGAASGVENLTLTGAGHIAGTGNELANSITGNTGNNSLSGLGGNDTLNGAAGADTLNGGEGNDNLNGGAGVDSMVGGDGANTYTVDNALDVAVETTAADPVDGGGRVQLDRVLASVTYGLGGQAEGVEALTLTGSGAIDGTGNGLANTLTGNTAANRLEGLTGHDTINGGAGDDIVLGGEGNDNLNGGNTFTSAPVGGPVVVIAGGNDSLDGGVGSDTLIGGADNDRLSGGEGSDTLVFAAGFGNDRVTGFGDAVGNEDVIEIAAALVGDRNGSLTVDFADLAGLLTQVGANTVLTIDGANTITLERIQLSSLGADDFRLF